VRTVLFLTAGILLMGGLLILGRLFSNYFPGAGRAAALVFVVVWFVLAGVNMWVGVQKAGYSVAAEAPIFLLIFGVPAALAWLIHWRLA
jgi:hypothetical protein